MTSTLFRLTARAIFSCLVLVISLTGICRAADTDEILLAAIFAHTGKAMYSDKPAINGTRFAVEEINRAGGVNGRQVKLLEIDNKSTPIGSHFAAQQAVEQGAAGIIGASWSSHSLAIAKVAQENSTVMISPSSTLPALTGIGDYIFRICYNDDFQGRAIAAYAFNDLRMRSALVFIDVASDFSVNLAQVFSKTFSGMGGRIVTNIEYKADDSNLTSQIETAREHNADIVFLSGHDESGYIAARLARNKVHAVPLGSDGWDAESFFTRGGNAISQGYYLSHWMPNPGDPQSIDFIDKFRGRGDIKAATALAYDAVNIFIAALKKAGTSDRKSIRDTLHNIKDFPGITGDISFDSQGDAHKHACVVEIRNGKPQFLKLIMD